MSPIMGINPHIDPFYSRFVASQAWTPSQASFQEPQVCCLV